MGYQHIMLIDDDEDDREIFQMAVNKISNIRCTAVDSAIVGLDRLVTGAVSPDIIFLDLNMPVMTGQQFLKTVKQIDGIKEIPVIIFSTSANPFSIMEAKMLGAFNYITKPYTYNDLVSVLHSIL